MIEHSALAKRYARALIAVAQETSKETIDVFGKQLQDFAEACKINPALLETLTNRYFDLFARDRIIDQIATKLKFDKAVGNFLKLLVQKGRIVIVNSVLQEYQALADTIMGREVMTVVSAVNLPDAHYQTLENKFSQMTGKKMVLKRQVNPDVLGGVRVHIHDRVYDYTVKNQLEQMKNRLLA